MEKHKGMTDWENITKDARKAELFWRHAVIFIKSAGRADILNNPTVLDLGGGNAEFSKYLNRKGIKCVSLDKQDLEQNPGAIQVKARADQMPFADESFDIVYAQCVFPPYDHHDDYPKLLAEMARILKPRGIFYDASLSIWPSEAKLEQFFKLISGGGGSPNMGEKIIEPIPCSSAAGKFILYAHIHIIHHWLCTVN